jgi:hypothetical protein
MASESIDLKEVVIDENSDKCGEFIIPYKEASAERKLYTARLFRSGFKWITGRKAMLKRSYC